MSLEKWSLKPSQFDLSELTNGNYASEPAKFVLIDSCNSEGGPEDDDPPSGFVDFSFGDDFGIGYNGGVFIWNCGTGSKWGSIPSDWDWYKFDLVRQFTTPGSGFSVINNV